MPKRKPKTKIQRIELTPSQRHVKETARRFNVLCCGARYGKTTFGIDLVLDDLNNGLPVAWMAPSEKNFIETWSKMRDTFGAICSRISEAHHRMEFHSGAILECWPLYHPKIAELIRGRKYARIHVDEAAIVPNLFDVWERVLRPRLVDLRGGAWFYSTPKGRNAFHRLWLKGRAEDQSKQNGWMSWQMSARENPHLPPEEFDLMRADMTKDAYDQEVEGLFIDNAGGVFLGVRAQSTAVKQSAPIRGHDYAIGADWGKQKDYTAFSVYDITADQMADFVASRGVPYTSQKVTAKALYAKWRPSVFIAEKNAAGEAIIDDLRDDGIPVQGFVTSNPSKKKAIDLVKLGLEKGTHKLLNDERVIAEFESFEGKELSSGLMKYSAPEGMHDDIVMAHCIAVWGGQHQKFSDADEHALSGAIGY